MNENSESKQALTTSFEQEITKPIITLEKFSLADDIKLDAYITPKTPYKQSTSLTNIFLTGSTGFLGSHILYELLSTTSATTYCLVRAQNTTEGLNKISHTLQEYGLWSDTFSNRIIPVIGDLNKKHFGLSEKTYSFLTEAIDHIYHCGALVNFILPYYLLKSTNVSGLQHILELSCTSKTIPITYLSTYSVLFSDHKESLIPETPPTSQGESLHLGYSQSKWVAEKIVEIAQNRNIPITTYRLGSITGDSETGLFNRKDFLTNFVDFCLKIQRIPKLNATIDMTPVNYAAKAIVELSQKDEKKPIYHILNPNPITWAQMTKGLQKIIPSLKEVSESEWINYAFKLGQPDHPFNQYIPLLKREAFSISDICLAEHQRCDTSNTTSALPHMFCPSINKELMKTYLKGIAYTTPKKHLYATPNLHTTSTLTSLITSHSPIVLQSFLHKPTARAAELISQFINKLNGENDTYKTFFANSQFEAFDGMIKLLRHNGNKEKRGYFSIAVFDPDTALQKKLEPNLNAKNPLRPNIQWITDRTTIESTIQDPTTYALILVISPLLSEYALIETARLAHKYNTKLIYDISRTEISFLPKFPRKIDGIIFGSNITNYQIPSGGFSTTNALYSVWNTRDNCLLHTSTFGGNTFATTLICETLFNTLSIPQSEQHIASLSEKNVLSLYRTYINPKLVALLQSMAMTKSVTFAQNSTLKWTYKGKKQTVIDALGSFACSLRGHNPSDLIEILRQFDTQKNYWKSLKTTLLKFSGFDDVIPAVSGASAVEIAITTALLAKPDKPTILTFKNGFSGKTLISLLGTTKEKYCAPFAPLYPNSICIDPFAPDAVKQFIKTLNDNPVGLVWFEIIQGEAGIKPLPETLLEAIHTHQKTHEYLIGIDEVQTGLFRTGKFLNYEGKMPKPDIVTIGKGLSDMACPIGAVLFKDHVLIEAEKTNSTYTSGMKEFYANQISSAISHHAIEYAHANHLDNRAEELGSYIQKELKHLEGKSLIKSIRGEGLLIGIELKQTFPLTIPFVRDYVAALFASCCLKLNTPVLVAFTLNNPNTVRLAPSLTITHEEVDNIINAIKTVASYSPTKLLIKSVF